MHSLSKGIEYQPGDIFEMTKEDIDFNTSSVKKLYNYISNHVKGTEINHNIGDVNR